ncbi:hypothetical protein KIPB_010056, partial [Kipferlia bialata]|eukprot:g10056.t1
MESYSRNYKKLRPGEGLKIPSAASFRYLYQSKTCVSAFQSTLARPV